MLQRLENVKSSPVAPQKPESVANAEQTEGNAQQPQECSTSQILLHGERKPPAEILKALELLISHSESEEDPEFPLPALDDVSHLALISHSIVAYLSHLDRQQLTRVTGSIAGETTKWLGALFRYVFYKMKSMFNKEFNFF